MAIGYDGSLNENSYRALFSFSSSSSLSLSDDPNAEDRINECCKMNL